MLPNVATVFMIDPSGRYVYLSERAPSKSFPGTLQNAGGKLEPGEDPTIGAARELFEETGIQVKDELDRLELLEEVEGIENGESYTIFVHRLTLKPGELPQHREKDKSGPWSPFPIQQSLEQLPIVPALASGLSLIRSLER